MKQKILEYNEEYQLFQPGDTLYLAVSGGPDSLSMLHFFASIQSSWNLTLYTVTVDHQLRGEASSQDALYVKQLSEQWGIPCRIGQVDVERYKKEHQVGTQVAARELRYQFFEQQLQDHAKLVLAHHQDDVVETMVMQFLKGVRPKGIPNKRAFKNCELIRPFLCLTKEDIKHYLDKHHVIPKIDPSNEEDTYTRNRVRKYLIPLLKEENPRLNESLVKLQSLFDEESDFLDQKAEQAFSNLIQLERGSAVFSISEFIALDTPLQRRVFHLILNYLYENHTLQKDYFDAFLEWMNSQIPNSKYEMPNGLTFLKAYDDCYVIRGHKEPRTYYKYLHLGEKIDLPNGWSIQASKANVTQLEDDARFFCDTHHISFPLIVRTRQNGDRIKPKGMNGHKKVKDIFIDHKIPKHLRDEWPVVTDQTGEILWIPYICKSHVSKDSGQEIIQITFDQ
ncbi:tRNA lysidine(34) synthetase TilS [Aquisalibacillus elongatus]|uniref:tRNA(Ile)-lysidine synthase n=1 Tax=Aquisalibacillus elongatus TaxID=485577 RepID=A0A3N5BNB3_9BACI|nr:tRNA lysidine(34) synthetase TilS [Aquisalibacillus elongatus]RPF51218.1 tRNA(Ile)-lysidine synthase [Aquisalibacillus elongatus]